MGVGLMREVKVGVYVGVVRFEKGMEGKVVGLKLGREEMVKDRMSEEVK